MSKCSTEETKTHMSYVITHQNVSLLHCKVGGCCVVEHLQNVNVTQHCKHCKSYTAL